MELREIQQDASKCETSGMRQIDSNLNTTASYITKLFSRSPLPPRVSHEPHRLTIPLLHGHTATADRQLYARWRGSFRFSAQLQQKSPSLSLTTFFSPRLTVSNAPRFPLCATSATLYLTPARALRSERHSVHRHPGLQMSVRPSEPSQNLSLIV